MNICENVSWRTKPTFSLTITPDKRQRWLSGPFTNWLTRQTETPRIILWEHDVIIGSRKSWKKRTGKCCDDVVHMYFNRDLCLISNYTEEGEAFREKLPVQIHSSLFSHTLYHDLKQMTFPGVWWFEGLPVHCPFEICEWDLVVFIQGKGRWYLLCSPVSP